MLYKWDIVGHENQLDQIEREIKEDNLSHAYLFSGTKQSGKFSIAKVLSMILQCPNNFCHTCKDCESIKSGSHPDTILMEDDGVSIKIDDVRELVRKTNLTSQGKYRIVVIENIERMPTEAQNSFLKTLEEPSGKTIFLLTTSQLDQVLLTIQSRVRHYHFSTVDDNILADYLQSTFGQRAEMTEVVTMAQGRPGLAISLMKDSEAFSYQKGLYHQIETFLKKNDLSQKFSFVEGIEKDAEKIELFLDAFTRYLRKLIFDFTHQKDHPLKKRFSLKAIVNLFDVLEKTRYFIKRNVNKRLALENLLIQTEKQK
ncbi:DNA polymerase III subunit delta' [Candidatus Pacearchaeota archaeon]|nr:DNA polymerase III subunit delta' [Candidatus Pacearchaeota archaeon]